MNIGRESIELGTLVHFYLYHVETNIGGSLLDYLLTGLGNKEVANKDEDEVDVDDDDDDEGLDSEVFEQGRSGSSDRSTEFELDSRE